MTNMSDGIRLGSLCNVSDCTAGGNSGNGFASSEIGGTGPAVGASIIHCTATANGNPGGGSGFTNYNGCLITGCMANLNWNHGIVVGSHCFVVQNSCDRNGDPTVPLSGVGSGVYLLGGLNRIEGNNLTQNANYGVEIPAASGVSVVIRNAASSNLFGPYLPVGLAGQAAGPVIGAAGMATDTNPNSNLAN
jgi:hypothetical protein